MDRSQLLNDSEQALRLALDGRQSRIWTAAPGIVTAVDYDDMTCSVQPAIQGTVENEDGTYQSVNLPLLIKVPIMFPSGGGFLVTLPIAVDDEVLVVFASRCIDAWWQSGGIQRPMEARMHDLSDGFAIPGPRSVPNTITIDEDRVQIRNDAGTVFFSMGTKFAMKNPVTDLKTTLSSLVSAINTFATVLAALTPPPTPVVNSVLQIPGAALVASLATVTTQINALLEDS